MSLLRKLVENDQVTSQEMYGCVQATVDDHTIKRILAEGLYSFAHSDKVDDYTKLDATQSLKRLHFNKIFWNTDAMVFQVLMFLEMNDYKCKSVCKKWNEIFDDTRESEVFIKQPYLTITSEQTETSRRLTGITYLYSKNNNRPVVAKIVSGLKFHCALGPQIVITGRYGNLKHVALTYKAMNELINNGNLLNLERNAKIEITQSTFNDSNYTTYVDNLRILHN